jgi:5-formyltetrahydrofolate cyclo-ligase
MDLAVVPGVAFDLERRRIGYGAGYYDRFLPRLRQDCLAVGVAYSLQLVENIQAGEHDIPMDAVITEDRILFDPTGPDLINI